MIRFKTFFEEFRGTGNAGIFRNPSSSEFKKLKPWVRGVVTGTGDIYIANVIRRETSLHRELMKRMSSLYGKDDPTIKYIARGPEIVTIQRIEKSNTFALGEIELALARRGAEDPTQLSSKKKAILRLARIKNPKIKFSLQSIGIFDTLGQGGVNKFGSGFSDADLQENINRSPKSIVPGLRYSVGVVKGIPSEFLVILEQNHDPIIVVSGTSIQDPEKFAKLANKIFKGLDFKAPLKNLNIGKLKELQRNFMSKIDVKWGDTAETSFQFVK